MAAELRKVLSDKGREIVHRTVGRAGLVASLSMLGLNLASAHFMIWAGFWSGAALAWISALLFGWAAIDFYWNARKPDAQRWKRLRTDVWSGLSGGYVDLYSLFMFGVAGSAAVLLTWALFTAAPGQLPAFPPFGSASIYAVSAADGFGAVAVYLAEYRGGPLYERFADHGWKPPQ